MATAITTVNNPGVCFYDGLRHEKSHMAVELCKRQQLLNLFYGLCDGWSGGAGGGRGGAVRDAIHEGSRHGRGDSGEGKCRYG